MKRFSDREDAGKQLAEALQKYKEKDVVVYALPRGGVVCGAEVAKALGAPLDLLIGRKIGHPHNEEYAIGAVAEDGCSIMNENEIAEANKKWLAEAIDGQKKEARRRREKYLGDRSPIAADGKTAIIVDDGLATGLTMRLAIKELKPRNPKKIIVAVPVSPADTAEELKKEVDDVVALEAGPMFLGAIGTYYKNFPQLEDAEVIALMKKTA
jgi:predicted phosphoribosyltransferase